MPEIGEIANNTWYKITEHSKNILSSIIGGYKSAVTKFAHEKGLQYEGNDIIEELTI